ncbi:ribonuclease HIII [bacterium]|nr:ribonuclease HIII [bacterium]
MGTYSAKYDKTTLNTLKNKLEQAGANFTQPQYTEFQARINGVVATFYTSGKLVVQGANTDEFLARFLNINQTAQTTSLQTSLQLGMEERPYPHIGVDESGKGDFFGPLCVAGVLLDEKQAQHLKEIGIKDSKKLDDKKILTLAQEIRKNSIYNTIHITPKKYNELYDKFKNLNKMLAWGHSTVIENVLSQKSADFAICDKFGDEKFILSMLKEKGRQIQIIQETKAEADTAVAAASILARAEYVSQMGKLCTYYEMNFPKGASDKVIQAGHEFVKKYGIEEMHSVSKAHFKTYQEFV